MLLDVAWPHGSAVAWQNRAQLGGVSLNTDDTSAC